MTLLIASVSGDELDDAINKAMANLNVRGASIVYYNANQNDTSTVTQPIIRGYGNVASSNNAPDVTPDTTFAVASVSKIFAGAVVSSLVDRGILNSLDDDICNVIPSDWDRSACRNPNHPTVPVTWRMLVTHRSSLRENIPSVRDEFGDWVDASYGPTGGYTDGSAAGNPSFPLDDVVGFYRDFLIDKETETSVGSDLILENGKTINWYDVGQEEGGAWKSYPPGQKSSYSNFGIGYIAALVELATGQPFEEYSKEYLFDPLGMTNTAWFRRDLPSDTRGAVPVQYFRRFGFEDVGHYCYIDYASGSLQITATDMSKWLDSMLEYGAPTLWSEETGKKAFQCQENNLNAEILDGKNCEFGVNWILLDNSHKANAESWMQPFKDLDWTDGGMHDGAEAGSQTQALVLPNAGVYLSVFTNTDGNDEWAAQKLARIVMRVGSSMVGDNRTIDCDSGAMMQRGLSGWLVLTILLSTTSVLVSFL